MELNNFFDCLTDILLKKSGGTLHTLPEFKKYFSNYMLCRYISMKPALINYAEYFNTLQSILSAEQMYILAYKLVPKQKSGFIKYLKKNKIKSDENEEEIINSNNMKNILFDL